MFSLDANQHLIDLSIHRVKREDSRAKILDTPSWDLVLDGSTVTLYTRFNYELHALSDTGYMHCFILCNSIVIRHLELEKNIYFSA